MGAYIKIIIDDEDIEDWALDYDLPVEAVAKIVEEWGSHIQDTASALIMNQIESILEHGQP